MEQRRLEFPKRKAWPFRNNRGGFTLIELLIAVAIFSVITIALYSSFNAGISVWRRAEENMELHQAVRLTLEGMGKELRNAIGFTEKKDSEETVEGEESQIMEKQELKFRGGRDGLAFVTLLTKPIEGNKFRKEMAKVSYSLDREGKLIRSVGFQSQGFVNGDSETEILMSGIEKLEFEYSYEAYEEDSSPVWKEYWEDQEGIPLGVKIHLKAKRKEGVASDFLKTVFIPTGILGKERELISE